MPREWVRLCLFVVGELAAVTSSAVPASADDLQTEHTPAWYGENGGLSVGLFFGSALFPLTLPNRHPRPPATELLGFDQATRGTWSPGIASLSDVTLAAAVSLPLGAIVGGTPRSAANGAVIDSEVLGADLLLSSAVKYLVARPRPYTYAMDGVGPTDRDDPDRNLSFYSGHASAAFAAAAGGTILLQHANSDENLPRVLSAADFALAGATAVCRVRAGQHFVSDVVVGSLLGMALGVGVPMLHGLSPHIDWQDLTWAGAGLVAGTGTAILLPIPGATRTPTGAQARHLAVVPFAGRASLGLSMNGSW
jgi:membrane-associated phospholipid phosphatase